MNPMNSSSVESESKKRITRREHFLTEMDQLMPWSELIDVVEAHYPKGERGRPRSRWSACCGCIVCNSGSACRTKGRKTR
jgi:hypothetical protein